MKWRKLLLICSAAVLITATVSHLVGRWLGINTDPVLLLHYTPSGQPQAPANQTAPIVVEGSSLIFFGLNWDNISQTWCRPIEAVRVPSASTCELEVLHPRMPKSNLLILGVSKYDLNEHFICDYRADIVPVSHAVRSMLDSGMNWAFMKRALGQYPLFYLRKLFPTAGHSMTIMVGFRTKIKALSGKGAVPAKVEEKSESNLHPAPPEASTKIQDWDRGRTMRNLSALRVSCQAKHTYDGPKHLAFEKMLRRGVQDGKVVVVVLPVSPPYEEEFGTPEVNQRFEASLAAARRCAPEAVWIRLDKMPELQSKNYYWDLVHLNVDGQKIATEAFLKEMNASNFLK